MSIFDTFIASAISGGSIAAGITWLARNWLSERLKQSIQHEYATQLEAHKATLKSEMDMKLIEAQARLTSENAVAIERFKSDLQVAASERQLRDKHVYDREAEAIATSLRVVVVSLISASADVRQAA
jgi:hypothetical protein